MEEAVRRISELDFPDGLLAAGVKGMEWWVQVGPAYQYAASLQLSAVTVGISRWNGKRHAALR